MLVDASFCRLIFFYHYAAFEDTYLTPAMTHVVGDDLEDVALASNFEDVSTERVGTLLHYDERRLRLLNGPLCRLPPHHMEV